jgi:hypothetical protein
MLYRFPDALSTSFTDVWKHAILSICSRVFKHEKWSDRGQCDRALSKACKLQVSKDLFDAKDLLTANKPKEAMKSCREALALSAELSDKRARRAVLRVKVCFGRLPFHQKPILKWKA